MFARRAICNNAGMAFWIIGALSLLFIVAVILVVFVIAWALADAEVREVPEKGRRRGKLRSFLSRFWSWANSVPPRLEYRRDKKGRFRKIRRG